MTQTDISPDEFRILQDYKQHAPYVLMKRKAEAILLASEAVPRDIIGRLVERAESTVAAWMREWNTLRLASIRTGHADNINASKLTRDQRKEVIEVLASPPAPEGLPKNFWDVPTVADWVYDHFGVVYDSPSSYHFLLHMAGLSFHRPEPLDRRRGDQADIDARMDTIRRDVADWQDRGAVVVCADEVRLEHEAVIRRAWCKKGAKTVVKVDRNRKAQSYIGFLNNATGGVDLVRLDWQNSGEIVEALSRLVDVYADQDIVIVWDNAGWHKSKELKRHLGPGNRFERIHLINLPPYCPDHNPIEHVWNEAKNSISNVQRALFDTTTGAFEDFITGREFPYRL